MISVAAFVQLRDEGARFLQHLAGQSHVTAIFAARAAAELATLQSEFVSTVSHEMPGGSLQTAAQSARSTSTCSFSCRSRCRLSYSVERPESSVGYRIGFSRGGSLSR